MFEHGADGISFETIVATGPNSAVPHHRPTGAVLASGDFVKLDFGAQIGGYHSGHDPHLRPRARGRLAARRLRPGRAAQAAGRAALTPGAAVGSVDAAARSVIEDAGHGEKFCPRIGARRRTRDPRSARIGKLGTGTLLGGAVVTVEPVCTSLLRRGGVRIEDTLVVREQGPELLTLPARISQSSEGDAN
ncbi:M24 family metallopeptidase [Rhodococcus hoagii]|nr:M24 family metallopeptidase [Prescottella equi]